MISNDVGENIVASYLEYIENCKCVLTNVKLHTEGRELDVLAVKGNFVYLCEVAIHINGLRYPRKGNKATLVNKFVSISKFAEEEYPNKKKIYMFWSPVVNVPKRKNSKNNAVKDIKKAVRELLNKGIELTPVINEDVYRRLNQLRDYAKNIKYVMNNPIMRFLQIEDAEDKLMENYSYMRIK